MDLVVQLRDVIPSGVVACAPVCMPVAPCIERRIAGLMGSIIERKEANKAESVNRVWKRFDPILITGSAFNLVFLVFQVIKIAFPKIAQMGGVSVASTVFGVAGGVINIAVAFVSLKEACAARKAGDRELFLRLLLDFISTFALGIIMVIASVGIDFIAIGAIGTFLAANPWFLPLIFFVISIPSLIQVGKEAKECLSRVIAVYKEGDHKKAGHYFIKFLISLGIGALMILTSFVSNLVSFDIADAFFSMHAWILPVLFFLATLPVLVEVGKRNVDTILDRDLASKLLRRLDIASWVEARKKDSLLKELPAILNGQIEITDEEFSKKCSLLMEVLQAHMGVEAAIEMMKLMKAVVERDEAAVEAQKIVVREKIADWKRSQRVRLMQKVGDTVLAILAVVASTRIPQIHKERINVVETVGLFPSSIIDLVMNILWPFRRNTPIVVREAV